MVSGRVGRGTPSVLPGCRPQPQWAPRTLTLLQLDALLCLGSLVVTEERAGREGYGRLRPRPFTQVQGSHPVPPNLGLGPPLGPRTGGIRAGPPSLAASILSWARQSLGIMAAWPPGRRAAARARGGTDRLGALTWRRQQRWPRQRDPDPGPACPWGGGVGGGARPGGRGGVGWGGEGGEGAGGRGGPEPGAHAARQEGTEETREPLALITGTNSGVM